MVLSQTTSPTPLLYLMRKISPSAGVVIVKDSPPREPDEEVEWELRASLLSGGICPGSPLPLPPGSPVAFVTKRVSLSDSTLTPPWPPTSLPFEIPFPHTPQITGVKIALIRPSPSTPPALARDLRVLVHGAGCPGLYNIDDSECILLKWDFEEAFRQLSYHPLQKLSVDCKVHETGDPFITPGAGTTVKFSGVKRLRISGIPKSIISLLNTYSFSSMSRLRVHTTRKVEFWGFLGYVLEQAPLLKRLRITLGCPGDVPRWRGKSHFRRVFQEKTKGRRILSLKKVVVNAVISSLSPFVKPVFIGIHKGKPKKIALF